jgi:hypothetical protein
MTENEAKAKGVKYGGGVVPVGGGTDTEVGKSNGGWLEAVVENGSQPRVPAGGGLRIYFAGGAYCQISSIGQEPVSM